ncbi:hypothetical protein [Rhodococcoides kroppenstedtii]|uniref:hypothetical protein n=1 Tax=Rhodococcoides kroppenstedtii TaxID=293050 RepID=UPI001FCD061F|nr:hypothetical protein [Rhodococcus kroppenstedtii]
MQMHDVGSLLQNECTRLEKKTKQSTAVFDESRGNRHVEGFVARSRTGEDQMLMIVGRLNVIDDGAAQPATEGFRDVDDPHRTAASG